MTDPASTPLSSLPLFAHRPAPTTSRHAAGPYPTSSPTPPAGVQRPAVPVPAAGPDPGAANATIPAQQRRYDPADVDWDIVRTFRQMASQRLAEQLRDRPAVPEDERRALGQEIVSQLLEDHARADVAEGRRFMEAHEEADLAAAVMDSLFGLGRLQPLIDLEGVENIEITGFDHVLLLYADGRREFAAPVADSDEELIEFGAFLAARHGGSERGFSSANPRLHLSLGNRSRLAAMMELTTRPIVRIRKNLLPRVTMDMLREVGTIDHVLQQFLAAAIRARKSIVISGAQASGKTTFTRALAGEIDPWEAVGTLETERELFINELGRPRAVIDIQARPGSGEFGANGRRAGEITQEELLVDSLRLNLDRLIVGEVRGPEAMAMFKAMQSGAGSISTIHAANARDTIERLITCVLSSHSNEAYAARLVASHIDLIVHLSAWADPVTGRRRRVVDEVIEVQTGEAARPAVNVLFGPDSEGRAVPRTPPSFLGDLVREGFDRSLLEHHGGTWDSAAAFDITALEPR